MKISAKPLLYPFAIFLMLCAAKCAISAMGRTEFHIRQRVVKLTSPQGSCSGEQVSAPSGVDYILTAGHCLVLKQADGQIHVITEDGREIDRRVIAEDKESDLALLEGVPGLPGLEVAEKIHKFEHVRTFTHGHGLPTYETIGTVVGDMRIQVPVSAVSNEEEATECKSMPKYGIIDAGFAGMYCALDLEETITTATIVPGSSGGMVINEDGELVGVASATDGSFGFLVKLSDIRKFLRNY